jgi:uncharacterized protein DUF222/HNH endonuclease
VKALEMAMDKQFEPAPVAACSPRGAAHAGDSPETDVSAETSEREPVHARRADAMAEIAETYLNTERSQCSTADRYQVVVHVTAETSHIEDGPHVSAETSRRIACDASIVNMTKDKKGEILSIGRKSRGIPPAIRRALRFRDGGCRFPGCTNTRFVDGHHIKHWADGGETSLDNLVQLCRRHHGWCTRVASLVRGLRQEKSNFEVRQGVTCKKKVRFQDAQSIETSSTGFNLKDRTRTLVRRPA